MGKRIAWSMLAVSALALGSAPLAAAHPSPKPLSDSAVSARAEAILAQMTPAEKAAQLVVYFALSNTKAATDQQVENGAGAVLFVSDAKETNRLQQLAMEKSRLRIPLLFGFDVI